MCPAVPGRFRGAPGIQAPCPVGPQSSRGLEATLTFPCPAQPSASRKESCPPPHHSHLIWLPTIFSSFSLLPFLPLLPTPFSCLSSSSKFPPAFYGKKGNIFAALKKGLIFNIIDPPPPTSFPGCGTSGAERLELIALTVLNLITVVATGSLD